MSPHADDLGITGEQFLLRALVLTKWIVSTESGYRPTSDSIKDANYETSCFIEGEITCEQLTAFLREEAQQHHNEGLLYQIDRGLRFARIPVALIREQGLIIERRPEEAAGCANPQAHVVIGPPHDIRRLEYEKALKLIVKDPRTTII